MIKRVIKEIKSFYDPDISIYASSLSFNTIFSLVPLLVVMFSIFTHLPSFEQYFEKIKTFIFSTLAPTQQETIETYIETFLDNSSRLGIIGLVFVIFASIMFFINYEYIVNKIFQVKPRNFWNSLTIYWTLITLAPIGLALSFYLSNKLQHLVQENLLISIDILTIFPYLIIWFIFFLTYKISATIYIDQKVAALSSFIASLIWDISKNIFVYYVIYSKTYTTIYGSFSSILFFLLWIYISWMIFLYGLKLCKMINEKYTHATKSAPQSPSETDCQK